jgi:hypothetical protein
MAINVRLRNAALNVNLQTPSVNNVRMKNTAINVRLQGNGPTNSIRTVAQGNDLTTSIRTVSVNPPPTSANQFNEFDLLDAFDGCTLIYDEARQKFVVGTIAVVSGGSF